MARNRFLTASSFLYSSCSAAVGAGPLHALVGAQKYLRCFESSTFILGASFLSFSPYNRSLMYPMLVNISSSLVALFSALSSSSSSSPSSQLSSFLPERSSRPTLNNDKEDLLKELLRFPIPPNEDKDRLLFHPDNLVRDMFLLLLPIVYVLLFLFMILLEDSSLDNDSDDDDDDASILLLKKRYANTNCMVCYVMLWYGMYVMVLVVPV
mmetsp:Transcript_45984/g.52215  ORF Transcript_45984/g.52215 Transcript_45984/m.52215 type:complete len:210 (+) Transcript_45984:71-700(+)